MRHIKAFENFLNQPDYGRFSEEETNPNGFPNLTRPNTPEEEKEEECKPCGTGEDEEGYEEEEDRFWGDEVIGSENDPSTPSMGNPVYVEKFNSFLEKKSEGKNPKNEKEKELAKKYPPENKITKGDFIAAAIENKKKGGKKDEKDSKASDKQKKKLPPALLKAIEAKKKK
jgi:hypothetical protein